ncbi:MAG: DUF4445 domain-containing protein [Lachnospiraceae bacterium]|nr:DUF4445 domain-containing protein [Lachnospiraceae bacterium]
MSSKPCTLCVGCGRCETYQADIKVLTKGGLPSELATLPCDVYGQAFSQDELLVCVDIGTTTVAMTLRRLSGGEIVDTYTSLNPQREFGSDVLSRMEKKDFAKEMRRLIEETIWQGVCQMGAEYIEQIKGVIITGNTTMLYLLRGRDTEELSHAPFQASFLEQEVFDFHGLRTIVMPGISAFVGADVLAGMFALSMDECLRNEVWDSKILQGAILLDLGTNGEMVYAGPEGLIATATPAAPAYEGGGFGEQIYGADYVSLLAYLLEQGYMDETGLLIDPYFEEGIVVADKRITQQDIRRLQLAKGATRAGLQILTKDTPVSVVYLAGGFGFFLDGDKAVRIGLLPEQFAGKVRAVGNVALEGAFLYGRMVLIQEKNCQIEGLVDNQEIAQRRTTAAQVVCEYVARLKESTRVINLAMEPDFEKVYLESINFPANEVETNDSDN